LEQNDTAVGVRAFPVADPSIWNNLPFNVTSASSLSTFRHRQKTYPVTIFFPDIILDCMIDLSSLTVDPEVIIYYLDHFKKFLIDRYADGSPFSVRLTATRPTTRVVPVEGSGGAGSLASEGGYNRRYAGFSSMYHVGQ